MRARRAATATGVALALVLTTAACGSSSHADAGNAAARSLQGATASTLGTAYVASLHATVLVEGHDQVLYVFAPDARSDVSCFGLCAATWPPAYAPADGKIRVTGGVVRHLVASDPDRETSRSVVTYGGWPLYTYASDVEPLTASGQAIDLDGGYWYVMAPDGQPIVPAGQTLPGAS